MAHGTPTMKKNHVVHFIERWLLKTMHACICTAKWLAFDGHALTTAFRTRQTEHTYKYVNNNNNTCMKWKRNMNEKKKINRWRASDSRMVLICKKPAKLSLHFYERFDLIYSITDGGLSMCKNTASPCLQWSFEGSC